MLPKPDNYSSELTHQDSITGLLLAGIGHVNQQQKKNFLVVDGSQYLASRNQV